jgi:4-hydroxy-L-threonine phosphate dehydrogenase PdxA
VRDGRTQRVLRIAGQGKADPSSMIAATLLAARIVSRSGAGRAG